MPFYEYECSKCQHTFDAMQKMSDDPLKTCPNCHQDSLIKLVSAPRFQLKGQGWYATDFKNNDKPPVAKAKKASEKSPDKADKTSKDTDTSTSTTKDSSEKTETSKNSGQETKTESK